MELPKLSDLISELHPVTEIFLRDMETIFDRWHPHDNGTNGGLPQPSVEEDLSGFEKDPCKKLFDEKKRQLLDELKEKGFCEDPMPIMKHNAPRDTAEHEALGTIGCAYFFGGVDRKFDSKCFPHAPVWAGRRITVRWSSKIVGPALIEDGVFINTSSVVKRTVICANSQIEEVAVISDSIIGRGVFIGPGVKILHRHGLNCDKEIVTEDWRDRHQPKIGTGRHKIGAIIGDGCVIGANTVLLPGTVLFPGCELKPGTDDLPAGIYTPELLRSGIPGLGCTRHPNCS